MQFKYEITEAQIRRDLRDHLVQSLIGFKISSMISIPGKWSLYNANSEEPRTQEIHPISDQVLMIVTLCWMCDTQPEHGISDTAQPKEESHLGPGLDFLAYVPTQ